MQGNEHSALAIMNYAAAVQRVSVLCAGGKPV